MSNDIPIETKCGYYEAQFSYLQRIIECVAEAETLQEAKSYVRTAQDILKKVTLERIAEKVA